MHAKLKSVALELEPEPHQNGYIFIHILHYILGASLRIAFSEEKIPTALKEIVVQTIHLLRGIQR
jgi:hypothetical protein